MKTMRLILVLLLAAVFLSSQAGAQSVTPSVNKGPVNRLEALPAPGQLQPIPRPPEPQQPKAVPPSPLPSYNRGAVNPRTGEFYPPQGRGIINPRTGEYYPPANGNGYFNPRTGEYYPAMK